MKTIDWYLADINMSQSDMDIEYNILGVNIKANAFSATWWVFVVLMLILAVASVYAMFLLPILIRY